MEIVLAPPPGLNSDDTTFGAQGAWVDGSNVRFDGGRPRSVGGSNILHSGVVDAFDDVFVIDMGGSIKIVYGGQQTLKAGTGFAWPSDISPASLPVTFKGWSFDCYGSTLMAALRDDTLYQWTGTGSATKIL